MKKYIIISVLFISISTIFSSAQVAMGKWRTHFAYNNVSQIAQSESKIYAVSEGALYSVDKQDGGLEFYSKINGLNSSTITRIEYDSTDKELLIIYSNGNIDVMTSGGIINIPDLYNKQMSATKDVNQILFYQNKAYLSCNFGILVLNMQKKEVADTYYIGSNASEVKVQNIAIHNGMIYALTSSAIFQASANETHLVNYEFWTTLSGLPGSGDFQNICSFGGQLILQRGGRLYKMGSDNNWVAFLPGVSATFTNVSQNSLNVFDGSSAYLTDKAFNTKTISSIGSISDAENDSINGTFYFAGNALGVIAYKDNGSGNPTINYYKPAGPAVNIPWDMTFSGKKLFVVPGGRWAGQYFRDGKIMIYEDGVWTNILSKPIQDSTKHAVIDFENVAVDPADNKHFFVTSYGTGLYEFKNNAFSKWYTPNNSILESAIPSAPLDYTRLDGAIYDKDGNLLLANSQSSGGVKILLTNGNWAKISNSAVNRNCISKLLISNQNQNQKWLLSFRYDKTSQGLAVYDDNGTYNTDSDDKSTFFSAFTYPEIDNNGLTKLVSIYPNYIYSIAQDKNGVIWVGTDMGPFLFSNLNNVFNSGYTCSRVKIPRNDSTNLADYLLVNENVKAIAIDGANRKWIGTGSGVYLMSENGQQTIQHFTMTNSPLLSNDIMSIAINPVSGEVFFGTSQGVVSYQSDASEAGDTFGNVYAYPNPVRQGYKGVITITGLIANTQVKITDINGNLVCETVSNGSLATWDAKDSHGRKVSTGIYLAICVNADGTQNTITKIMVIN